MGNHWFARWNWSLRVNELGFVTKGTCYIWRFHKWKNEKIDDLLAKKFKELWNVVIWFDMKNETDIVLPYSKFYENVK